MAAFQRLRNNRSFKLIIVLYTCFLFIVSFLAIYYSYHERQNAYINEFDKTAELLEKEYDDVLENFWQIYMPVFEDKNSNYHVMYNYFSNQQELTPFQKKELVDVLKAMIMRDNRIQWLAIYRGESSENYILFSNSDTLVKMEESFPYWQHLKNKYYQMEVYETSLVDNGDYKTKTFAIAGGTVSQSTKGAIIAGFDISCFSQYIGPHAENEIYSDYVIKNTFGTVLNTSNVDAYENFTPSEDYTGIVTLSDHQKYYARSIAIGGRLSYNVTYFIPWWPLFLYSVSPTLLITILFVVFSLLALALYLTEIRSMSKKINETTLSEIQAKFNPHFLYNFLEALREKIYFSGDYESANALVSLSSIFRKLVSGENFVTIRDELAFCDMYISLFKNYYSNNLEVVYDIDNEVLNYGIIRNLLQPLVENYFVHGFDHCESSTHHISIKGSIHENRYIVITYEDNGLGMTLDELKALKQQISSNSKESSFGLKSIYKRIKLFYGKDCGIELTGNHPNGLVVRIKIKKMTIEEHKTL